MPASTDDDRRLARESLTRVTLLVAAMLDWRFRWEARTPGEEAALRAEWDAYVRAVAEENRKLAMVEDGAPWPKDTIT
jgi:hypothetical protein